MNEKRNKNLEKMLLARGYDSVMKQTLTTTERVSYIATSKDDVVYVFDYSDVEDSFRVLSLRHIIEFLDSKHVHHAIIIIQGRPTSKVESECVSLVDYDIEFFRCLFFRVCIIEHSLVPKHHCLSSSEKEEFLLKYPTTTELPKLLCRDPIVRFYHYKIGDIIHIRRHIDPCLPPTDFYRVVVTSE